MSNDPVSKIVTATVGGFVKDGKMFSAYDVTTKIRGMGIYCKHDAIKTDIHSAMGDVINDGSEDYEKTLVDTGSYRTFVYHKSSDDPHTYNQTPTVVTPNVSTTLSRDNRGRVCVPADMLRSIGATYGNSVIILPNVGEVVVCNTNSKAPVPDTCYVYKVDKDNNVRISASVFAKAKLGTTNSFNVLQVNNSIKVY